MCHVVVGVQGDSLFDSMLFHRNQSESIVQDHYRVKCRSWRGLEGANKDAEAWRSDDDEDASRAQPVQKRSVASLVDCGAG